MEIVPQLIINSLIAGAIYTILALGFNLIYSTVKFFDLSYGALTTFGGYAVFYLFRILGLNIFLSIILGVFTAGLTGFLIYKFIYATLRKRKSSNIVLLVASLGVFTALQALIAIVFSNQLQTLNPHGSLSKVFEISTGAITQTQIIIIILSLIAFGLLALLLKFTMFGKAVKAISDDEEVSKIVGINSAKVIGVVFFIGAAIAGLSGILVGFDTGIEPTMGMPLLLKGVIASIVGGVGNIYGGVAGAFLLGFVENFGIWKISGEWKDAIAFGVLILFLIFRPRGMFSKE